MCPLNQMLFFPLMSLLFFSDLNMTSNQLSFWSSPRSILMAARPTPWASCLLLTENATLQSRTERQIFFFCGKIQFNQPMMKEGYKHNLFLSLPVLVLVTTEWEYHALTFGDPNKLEGPKYCIFMIFL